MRNRTATFGILDKRKNNKMQIPTVSSNLSLKPKSITSIKKQRVTFAE